jgi:hypothetical protein
LNRYGSSCSCIRPESGVEISTEETESCSIFVSLRLHCSFSVGRLRGTEVDILHFMYSNYEVLILLLTQCPDLLACYSYDKVITPHPVLSFLPLPCSLAAADDAL